MKKAFCIILTLIMTCACVLPAASAADTPDAGERAPVIRILGLGGSFYDGDTLVFPPQAGTVIPAIMKAISATPALLTGVLDVSDQERVLEVAGAFFDPIAFDKNGEPANGTVKDTGNIEDIDFESGDFIAFDYDWRLDPFTVAEQLKDFIEYVKRQTGSDGVYLVAESMGTVEMDTYFSRYGFDGILGAVWYNGAYRGVASCSDSFSNQNNFSVKAISDYLNQLGVFADSQLLYDLFAALESSGLLQTVFDSVYSGTLALEESGMFSRFLREYIGRIPGFWSLVSSEDYPAAREFAFPTDEIKEEYSVLLEKLDRYYNEVSSKTDEIMANALEKTGKVGVVCGYGEYMPPVTSDSTRQSDSVILTADESSGATCAPIGETFAETYVQKINDGHDHISPDRVIDASTAFFPDNTWFVKFGHHSFSGGKELTEQIFFTEGFNVFSSESYPQFLVRDPDTGELSPLTSQNGEGKAFSSSFTEKLLKAVFWAANVFLKIYKSLAVSLKGVVRIEKTEC